MKGEEYNEEFVVMGIKLSSLLASLALFFGVVSAQSTCYAFYHQPKVPQGMSKFIRK
jgi:cyclic lactone autoinducer peptide